jgi:hypothetical protein
MRLELELGMLSVATKIVILQMHLELELGMLSVATKFVIDVVHLWRPNFFPKTSWLPSKRPF